MAYVGHRFGSHQSQTAGVLDAKRVPLVDEDDSAVLDSTILDSDIMQSPSYLRKDSLNSNGIMSPAESAHTWDQQYIDPLNMNSMTAGSSTSFHDDNANVYSRMGRSHPSPFAPQQHQQQHQQHQHQHQPQQQQAWTYDNSSGNCTPTNNNDFHPPQTSFDPGQFVTHRNEGVHSGFIQPPPTFSGPHAEAGFIPAPQVQTPMSPHSHEEWKLYNLEQQRGSRSGPGRLRSRSPPRHVVNFQGAGIRKKNGRIDIPQERNINTIDEMIDNETNEDLIKELKQQKRLLRNREAALASRQRKKKHTEDLEVKEKAYTQQVTQLKAEVSELTMERDHALHERQSLAAKLQVAMRVNETSDNDVRDLMIKHNEETSALRKRIQLLTEQLEHAQAPGMSTVPSSTGFTDFNAEMESLNMGAHDWDSFIYANDLHQDTHEDISFDAKPNLSAKVPTLEKKASTGTIVPASKKRSNEVEEPVTASGLLFMLLLCGAFVASRPANSLPRDMPPMPADVRAAAPTVLNNLLAESTPTHAPGHTSSRINNEPMISGHAYGQPPMKRSRLDRMHHGLIAPTKQQEMEQAFSLTTSQYSSITGMDYAGFTSQPDSHQDEDTSPRRQNLAEALANLEQGNRHDNKAEIYTRSLLLDQVPPDALKQFREFARDLSEIEARQQNQ